MSSPYELLLALRYLRFHRGRSFLSVITVISALGVAVGTAALVIALSLMTGFVQDIHERIYSGSAHLTVLSLESPDLFPEGEALARRLETIPGVRAASPVIYTPALLTYEPLAEHGFAELHGVDPEGRSRVLPGDRGADRFAGLAAPTESGRDGILLGEGLAARLGARSGDSVRVLVPRATLAPWGAVPRNRVFEVVGTYRSEHFEEDSRRAYVPLEAGRELLRADRRSSWVDVRVEDARRLAPMKQRLRGELGDRWVVVDLIEQNREILKALNTEKLLLFVAIGLIVVVAALNIVSTLILMVADKVREIGALSAMGARPRSIALVFVLQGLIIGSVGTVVGLTLGSVICWWLDRYEVIRLNPEVYYVHHIPFTTRPTDLVLIGVAAMAISLLATIYPAVKAARLDPVEALRYE